MYLIIFFYSYFKLLLYSANESSSSSSESEEDCFDEEGLQGYTDRIMLELQRKQSHPRRLHPEMWLVLYYHILSFSGTE